MWRSIARSNQSIIRNLLAIRLNPTDKVQSLSSYSKTIVTASQSQSIWDFTKPSFNFIQNPRFLSQLSTDYENEQASIGFDHDDGIDSKNENFVENYSTQMNSESGIVDVDENPNTQVENSGLDDGNVEPGVFEVDVVKLESVLSLLQSSVDGSLESTLDAMDLHLHEEFMVRVLETPLLVGGNLIAFFKWAMEKPEFKLTTPVVDRLVGAVCRDVKKKDAYALWDLVKEINEKEKGLLVVDSLNELISLLSKLGKGKAAVEVFDKFEDFECTRNAETYYLTIEALCRRSYFEWAWTVCEKMLDSGSLPESDRLSKIISWFCKGHKAKEAHSVYIFAKEKEKNISQSSVNFLILSLCKNDETVKLSLEMLDDFVGEARKYAIKPFLSVVRALCRTKEVDKAVNLVSKMISEGPPPGNAVFNSIIEGYSKSGDLGKAKDMVKLMQRRGLKPDVYTYTVIMSGHVNGGQMVEASKLLAIAKKEHSKLSLATYHTLIRGYCELEEFDKALKLFTEMKDFGVEANVGDYNKLIKSLCLKALDWETADTLFNEMKAKGLPLSGSTHALIRAVKELQVEGSGDAEESVQSSLLEKTA